MGMERDNVEPVKHTDECNLLVWPLPILSFYTKSEGGGGANCQFF